MWIYEYQNWPNFTWNAGVLASKLATIASWRTIDAGPMQVVSGAIGKEKVHFEAPKAESLEEEMQAFLAWFAKGDGIDPVIYPMQFENETRNE